MGLTPDVAAALAAGSAAGSASGSAEPAVSGAVALTTTLTAIRSDAPCQLWLVDLDAPLADSALASLSSEERARATRFAFDRDRQRYLAAHVALRHVLSAATHHAVADLRFEIGPAGKPHLAGSEQYHFNLSHSDRFGLIAISLEAEIGVDLEMLRPMPDWAELVQAHFSPAEFAALEQAEDAPTRDKAFLLGWTRKEACLKAIGIGLDHDLRALQTGVSAATMDLEVVSAGEPIQLSLHSFDSGDGFVASVAFVRSHRPALLQ